MSLGREAQALSEDVFAIGDLVAESGLYVCVPCGYVEQFSAGDRFKTCDACLAGTADGPSGYRDSGAEFWRLVG